MSSFGPIRDMRPTGPEYDITSTTNNNPGGSSNHPIYPNYSKNFPSNYVSSSYPGYMTLHTNVTKKKKDYAPLNQNREIDLWALLPSFVLLLISGIILWIIMR
jgi:hypothetical protein